MVHHHVVVIPHTSSCDPDSTHSFASPPTQSPSTISDTNHLTTSGSPQEARAVRQRTDAEELGQRLAEVRERLARAEVDAGAHRRPDDQQRHVLARVVGARRRRIVAVIGGDDEQIVGAEPRQQRGQPRVEALEVGGVAREIVAMAVDACRSRRGWRRSGPRGVASSARSTSSMPSSSLVVCTARDDAAAGEQILDLADRDDRQSRRPSSRSSSVGADGGSAKSWRLAVRWNAPGTPTNGRAMTRPDATAARRPARTRSRSSDTARAPARRLRARRSGTRCRPRCRRSARRSACAPARARR